MEGWIKLHRKFIDWEWYTDNTVKALFIHLLLSANHQPKNWRGQTIYPGETVTSVASLAAECGLSTQQVRSAISKLEKTGEIKRKSTNKNTLIIVVNYSVYQGLAYADQQTNNKQDNKQITNETTNKQQTNNNKQECKNERIKEYISNTDDDCARARERLAAEFAEYSDFDLNTKSSFYPLLTYAELGIINDHISKEKINFYLDSIKYANTNNHFETIVEWAERDGAWQ